MSPKLPVSQIQHVKRVWERIAPLQLADHSWDNVGIMIESPIPTLGHKQVLLTIDLTTAVCNEALALPSCSVVVSYHPPIFRGLKSMTLSDPLQASLLRLASRGISVFSPHTSLDATPNGINTWYLSSNASLVKLKPRLVEPFIPYSSSSVPIEPGSIEGSGMGKLVALKDSLSVGQIVQMVKQHLGLQYVQLSTPDNERPIESIAVCAGSGASMFKGVKADLLLTGEMSHHEVLAARAAGTAVILTNHTNTERPYLTRVLRSWLQKELNHEDESGEGEWEVLVSRSDQDSLRVV